VHLIITFQSVGKDCEMPPFAVANTDNTVLVLVSIFVSGDLLLGGCTPEMSIFI
jgi:hypothetical protein